MPLQDYMNIISVDDHLIEHPRVWSDRLPNKYVEQGPRIEENDEGHQIWVFEGRPFPQIALNAVAGKDAKDYGIDPVRYDDMIPGCYNPAERIKDMDLDGVWGALCFPSFPGFGGGVFHRAKDKDLSLACVQAWNDFHVDEWCGTAPDRFIALGMLPTWDAKLMVAEMERIAAKGVRTVSIPDSPLSLGLPSYHNEFWEPIWSAAERLDLPLSMHFGSGGFVPGFSSIYAASKVEDGRPAAMIEMDAPLAVSNTLFGSNLMWTTVDLLFSGVLQKHPNLKILLSEGGIGWIPYVLERADYVWDRHRWYQNFDEYTKPSELFRKHFWGCFIDDEFGLKNRHEIGIDRLLIEVDYPHSDSSWPNTRKHASTVLADVPDDEVHQIVELNARKVLRFPA